MKKLFLFVLIMIVFIVNYAVNLNSAYTAEPPPALPTPTATVEDQEIEQVGNAVLANIVTVQDREIQQPVYTVDFDTIRISADRSYATGWIIQTDPVSGEAIPTEPGIFIAELIDQEWKVYLPAEKEWSDAVSAAPIEILSIEEKDRLLGTNDRISDVDAVMTDGGYLLPWAEGQTVYLSQSVSHDEYIPSGNAHYAFDFYVPKTMFNLYASKAGTVWSFKDTVPNNDHTDVNFIVLRNADNPNLYQLYLHLAQNSIPPSLKSIGAQVIQGQFVGVADNTGASTGHHLHFQVQTTPYWPYENPYWGQSVDITFNEVGIYGGRPRTPYEYDEEFCGGYCVDGTITYISANVLKGDLTPPIGDFTGVSMGQIVDDSTLNLLGWASDADSGLYSGQIRALYDGAWHDLGDPFQSAFSYTWDMCSESNPVPKGVVSLGLKLYDWDGNWADYAGLTHFIKGTDCTNLVTPCNPTTNQIALYEDGDFAGGCVVLNGGNFPDAQSLEALGDNDAASIRVGSNVQATLFSTENYHGHGETFVGDDNNLTDNLIGINNLTSLKVGLKTESSGVPILLSPPSGTTFNAQHVVHLSWESGNNSVDFQVRYTLNGGSAIDLPWQDSPYLYLNSLAVGDYTWQARGRNSLDVAGPWSSQSTFEVITPPALPPPFNAPYTDDMESSSSDWISSGLWDLKDDSEISYSGTHSWWYQGDDGDYDNGATNQGILTSPPINIPSAGFYLRFMYRYHTETKGSTWDQRWLQVSAEGGPFENVYQLQDDPQISETSSWLQSKAVDLSDYAGQTVRIRFQFASLDASMNSFPGWGIDDFKITNTAPPGCADEDNAPAEANELSYSDTDVIPAVICPGGDYDYYQFDGKAGDRIVADIDAQTIESPLDSYIVLLGSDGKSVLAEHDDEVYAERRDPLLSYSLPHDGTYFIKVRAWKHPSVGDADHEYTIRLYKDVSAPLANILIPTNNSYIPLDPISVTAQVVDVLDGVGHVDFYWHDYDWVLPTWEYLGSDWDAGDGWKINFDPEGLLERNGGAFHINAFDKAANLTSAGVWNIGVDLTAPSTDLSPAEDVQESSAILLNWTGTDQGSGLAYANLQFTLDDETWQNHPDKLYSRQDWYIGSPGNDYGFRLRGVDIAGNIESYPTDSQANTSIPVANVLCSSPDQYEGGEGDNSANLAKSINPEGDSQIHNYCNLRAADRLNDEDWVKFTAQKNVRYLIRAVPLFGNVGTIIELYAQDGTTLLGSGQSSSFGHLAYFDWTSDRDGDVYLRLRHLDGRVIGNIVAYVVEVSQGYQMYFPLLNK